MAHGYPFGFLCPPGSYTITLSINDRDSKNDDWLIPPGATPLNPLYHFYYSPRAKDGSFKVTVEHLAQGRRTIGTVHFPAEGQVTMDFPWLKWNISLIDADGNAERWSSDVGTLEGHELEWQWMGWFREGFVLRCFDVDDAYSNACAAIMTDWRTGRIEMPVHLIRDQNGLDEMVTIAMVAMQRQREFSLGQMDMPDGWEKPGKGKKNDPLPARPGSSSSSSSSSSSATSHGKKKKSGKKKLFGKLGLS